MRRKKPRFKLNKTRRLTMYAVINIPGSGHFRYFGPAKKRQCQEWLTKAVADLEDRGEQLSATTPRRIISNKEAESWTWADGKPIVGRS